MFKNFTVSALLGVILTTSGWTQEVSTKETSVVTPELSTEVRPLSATEIATRADNAKVELSELLDDLQTSSTEIDRTPTKTKVLRDALDELLQSVDSSEIRSIRNSDFEILDQSMNSLNAQVGAWQKELQQRIDYLDQKQQLNKVELKYFESISQPGGAEDLPAALVDRSVGLSKELADIREQLLDRLDLLLRNLTEVSELEQQIRRYTQLIDADAERRRQELFVFSSPAIWEIPKTGTGPIDSLVFEFRSRSDVAVEFLKTNSRAVIILLLLLAVMMILAGFFYRSKGSVPDLPIASVVKIDVLNQPFSVSVLFWVLVGPELFLPPTPVLISTVRVLIAIIALLRLLPAIFPGSERPIMTALLVLCGAEAIVYIWPLEEWIGRTALITISMVGIILFQRLGRALKLSGEPHDLWWIIGRILTILAPFILGVTILGAMLGAVSLAVQMSALFSLFVTILVLMVVEASLNIVFENFIAGRGRDWLRFVRNHPDEVRSKAASLIRIAVLAMLIMFIPRFFPVTQVVFDWLGEVLSTEFSIGSVIVSLANVFVLIFGIVIAITLARFIRILLDEDIFPRLSVASGAASAASRLIYYALVTGGILFALAVSGVELTNLTLLLSALGVGIGFGLQGIVNNFVSGLVLAFERPFQAGDIIAIGDLTGRVREIGLRASRVRTFEGAEVIVPNANLVAGEVINWTLSDRMRRVDVNVGVAYGSDTAQVRELLIKVADDNERVASNPAPIALFLGFGESELRFTLRVWAPEAGDWLEISSDIYEAVNSTLQAAGIEIPFPQRTVHLDKGLTSDR